MGSDGYLLSEKAVRRLAAALKIIERFAAGGGAAAGGNPPRDTGCVFPAKTFYRIVSNEEAGAYTAQLQEWDAEANELADVTDPDNPEYSWAQDAWDFLSRNSGSVDQIVPGWRVWVNDAWVLVLDVGTAPEFWGVLGTATSDGDYKWTYPFDQVRKATAGYGGWATFTGAVSGTARNSLEDMNSDSGVQGNGVNLTNLDTTAYTFTIQPAPAGAIVRVHAICVEGSSTIEYWFEYANGVDGSCD